MTSLSEEENHLGVNFSSPTLNCTYRGRGIHYTSHMLRRNRKQLVLITREIPHFPDGSRGGALT